MKETFITILIIAAFRLAENLLNKWVEKSKLTENTWDDQVSYLLREIVRGVSSIFKLKK